MLITYRVYPLFFEGAVIHADANSLMEALELAFNCKLYKVGAVYGAVEYFSGERTTFYGIGSALGARIDNPALLCGATAITHQATEERLRADVESLSRLI